MGKRRREEEEDDDNTIPDNLGVIDPPTDSPEMDAAKAEKLDRATRLHTLCYHPHIFKGEVLEELWPQATYGNCYARHRGRELFMTNVKRYKNEIIGPEGTEEICGGADESKPSHYS